MKNLIEYTKFMTKPLVDNTSVKRKVTSNMVKESINLKKEGLIMKASGEIIKWKEKENLTLSKVNFNILVNGKPTNIMDGVFFTQILPLITNGSHTKGSSKMESSKAEVK